MESWGYGCLEPQKCGRPVWGCLLIGAPGIPDFQTSRSPEFLEGIWNSRLVSVNRISRPGALYDASDAALNFGDVEQALGNPIVIAEVVAGYATDVGGNSLNKEEAVNFPHIKGYSEFLNGSK